MAKKSRLTQQQIRMLIFFLWIGFWILSTIALVLGPFLRTDKAVGDEQIPSALLGISSIWVPILTCFAAFWFPEEEREEAKQVKVSQEKAIGAITLNVVYLLIVFLLLLRPIYFITYPTTVAMPKSYSFPEQMAEAIKLALLFSPLPLAPIYWMTGGRR